MADGMQSLYESLDTERWKATLDSYDKILSAKASRDKKGKSNDLLKLDKWYQEELPLTIRKRSEAFINQEELTKLMHWKLSRGKFRPRLTQLVQTNGDNVVTETSKRAFKCLPDVKAAVEVMSKLKAVGPATASAILCAGNSQIPFMADETMMAIPGLGKIDYNLKFYLHYVDKIRECLQGLHRKDPEGQWTEHKVELALWCHVTATKIDPSLVQVQPKRKLQEVTGQSENSDSDIAIGVNGNKRSKSEFN